MSRFEHLSKVFFKYWFQFIKLLCVAGFFIFTDVEKARWASACILATGTPSAITALINKLLSR
jgi:hypothetical protein